MVVNENDKAMSVWLGGAKQKRGSHGLGKFGRYYKPLKKYKKQKKPFSLAMIKIRGETQVMMISEKTWENEVCWHKYFGTSRYYSTFHCFSARSQDY